MTDLTHVHFLPYMRTGLAADIEAGAGADGTASVTPSVDLHVEGQRVETIPGPQIVLSGPGDVLSLDPTEIKRRTPDPGATDVEGNYFAAVEFYSPDLPWRYTPAGVDADGRLAPWLVLVVVELGVGATLAYGGRLPVLTVEDPETELPDLAESWAWAHVQASTSLSSGLAAAYASDPGAFSSRLMCPRRLEAGGRYTACIVPAYDAGVRTGLGQASQPSLDAAWGSARVELPVYDSWEFTVGERGDFKTLVRRITPRELDPDVGSRDLDVSSPGGGLPGVARPLTWFGAMHAPNDGLDYWPNQTDKKRFTRALRSLLNEPDPGAVPGSYDPLLHDPVVGPPVYGAPQVGRTSVPAAGRPPRWFGDLSTEPQHRTVAGLGAEVVRADQEALMAAAWEQARSAVEANRLLNRGRLAQEAALFADQKLAALDDALAVQVAGPALQSVRVEGTSVWALIRDGDSPSAYFGAAFRRLGRPRGPLSSSSPVAAARAPARAITEAVLVAATTGSSEGAGSLCTDFRTRYVPPGMDTGVDLLAWTSGPASDVPIGRGTITAKIVDRVIVDRSPTADRALTGDRVSTDAPRAGRIPRDRKAADEATAKGAPGDRSSTSGAGKLDRTFALDRITRPKPELATRQVRIEKARRPSTASLNLTSAAERASLELAEPSLWQKATKEIPVDGAIADIELVPYEFELVRPTDLGLVVAVDGAEGQVGVDVAAAVRQAARPALAIEASVRARVVAPQGALSSTVIPTHTGVQPRFVDPMYERLRALSVEYLVPGIGTVPENTLGLLEVNPAYVEAFLVGLNHELSREFRWREYPASLNQTWFRHFWDTVDPDEVDIPPIADWDRRSRLGSIHGAGEEPMLVVLLKGELIRRFPDVRIYAFPAHWDEGTRQPEPDGEALAPRFVGTLQPGVNFYGFDLTEEDARGDGGQPGWFLVLEEEPRAMRFGLDSGLARDRGRKPATWTDLSWPHLTNRQEPVPDFCTIDTVERIETASLAGNGGTDAWGEDAAGMARITFRRPVQVFMHATAMLPEPGGVTGG